MATILVTGGAGYIGAVTVKALLERGDRVVVLDTLATSKAETIDKLKAFGDVQLVVGDIADTALVDTMLAEQQPEAVVHFAAWKNAGESMQVPVKYFENNVGGTNRLLDSLQRAGVRQIVFSGSCSVYGTPAELPVNESFPIHPESVYAHSKRMCEELMAWYDQIYGVRGVSLRYFNAAGASPEGLLGEQPERSANLIPVVMEATLGRRPKITVFGTDYPTRDGTCIRDYIHVVDLADAHVRALDFLAREDRSEVFNIGTGTGTTVKEIVTGTERVSGRTVPVEYGPRRAGDPVAIWADNTKARTLLGWEPRYGLDEILAHAWAWHAGLK
jgi:UDP-glucose-4-epimerase GalE